MDRIHSPTKINIGADIGQSNVAFKRASNWERNQFISDLHKIKGHRLRP